MPWPWPPPRGDKGRPGGLVETGKRLYLQQQFLKQGIHLCGIQEARLRAGSWPTEHYQVYSSGSVKGNWGCALLVATEAPYARASDDTPLVFKPSQITPVFGDERILVLKFNAPLFRRTVIVAHAPYLTRGSAAATAGGVNKRPA